MVNLRKFDTSSKKKKKKENHKNTFFSKQKQQNSKKSICELKVPFFTLNSPLLTRHVTCSDTEIQRYGENLGDKKLPVEHTQYQITLHCVKLEKLKRRWYAYMFTKV